MLLLCTVLVAFAENQNVIYVPQIRNHESLSKQIRTELALATKGRPLYVLTTENFSLYIQKENITLAVYAVV